MIDIFTFKEWLIKHPNTLTEYLMKLNAHAKKMLAEMDTKYPMGTWDSKQEWIATRSALKEVITLSLKKPKSTPELFEILRPTSTDHIQTLMCTYWRNLVK